MRSLLAMLIAALAIASQAAAGTASKCSSKEMAAAGKKAGGKVKCWSKATSKGLAVDGACLSKAETKFSAAYSKAQGKGDCLNGTTAGTIETKVDNFINDLVMEINGNTGTPTASKCSSKELAAAGKKAGGVVKCYAKAAGKGDNTIIPPCISAAQSKFSGSWTKATGSPPCNTGVTQSDIENKVDSFAADVNGELTGTPATSTTSTMAVISTTTSTSTLPACDCCSQSHFLSFTTASAGCGMNPSGSVSPARCVQASNNGTACTDDSQCTGGGVCRGHLDCSGLYFGGGQPPGIRLPARVPDLGLSFSKIASCTAGNPDLSPTSAADVPTTGSCTTPAGTPTYGQRHCTSPGCLFGPPLAIPNPGSSATGTCVVNLIANRPGAGTGTADCNTGVITLSVPLDSQIYLTGGVDPIRVCSTCVGGTPGVCGSGTCMGTGGPRTGMPCTPETSASGNGQCSCATNSDCGSGGLCSAGQCFGHCTGLTITPCTANNQCPSGQTCIAAPTVQCTSNADCSVGQTCMLFHMSHDCPPPNAPSSDPTTVSCAVPSGSFIGCLPIDLTLSTGTHTKTSFTTTAQPRVFCGFCFDPNVSLAFENPPHTCTSDAACTNGNFTSCQQQSNGAFRNSAATTITETGTPANACIADGVSHPATLVSVFCIPPSYNGVVDPAWELPGPGAVSLPGTAQLVAAPGGPPSTHPATTTTTTTLPTCTTEGASCGSCGNGVCASHCGAPGTPLFCADNSTFNTPGCASDTACAPGDFCAANGSTNCGTGFANGCTAPCP